MATDDKTKAEPFAAAPPRTTTEPAKGAANTADATDADKVPANATIRGDAVVDSDGNPIKGLTVEGGKIVAASGFKVKDGKVVEG